MKSDGSRAAARHLPFLQAKHLPLHAPPPPHKSMPLFISSAFHFHLGCSLTFLTNFFSYSSEFARCAVLQRRGISFFPSEGVLNIQGLWHHPIPQKGLPRNTREKERRKEPPLEKEKEISLTFDQLPPRSSSIVNADLGEKVNS